MRFYELRLLLLYGRRIDWQYTVILPRSSLLYEYVYVQHTVYLVDCQMALCGGDQWWDKVLWLAEDSCAYYKLMYVSTMPKSRKSRSSNPARAKVSYILQVTRPWE